MKYLCQLMTSQSKSSVSHTVHACVILQCFYKKTNKQNNDVTDIHKITLLQCLIEISLVFHIFYRMLKRTNMLYMHLLPREDDQTRTRPALVAFTGSSCDNRRVSFSSELLKTVH